MIKLDLLKNKKMQLLILLIITLIVILLPTIIRILQFKQIILPSDTIYYDIRMAQDIHNNNLLANDQLVFTQTEYVFNPLHYFLAILFIIIHPKITIILLTLFFSVMSIVLLYKIMENLSIPDNYKIITLILYILSPIFISSAIFLSKFTLGLLLFLALIYLKVIEKKSISVDIIVVFLAVLLFYISLSFLFFAIFFLFFYSFLIKKNLKKTIIMTAIIIFIIISLQQIAVIRQFTDIPGRTIYTNIFQETIADLGAFVGFGIFSILLFALGLYVMWKKQPMVKKYILFIIVLLIITYYFSDGKYLFNLCVSIISAIAFIYLLEQEWKLSLIKDVSLFILILGIIFSGLSTITRITAAYPTLDEYHAILFLQQQYSNINNQEYILSYYRYGHLLQSIPESNGKLPVFLDTKSYELNKYLNQSIIANELFYSRDIKKTTQLLTKYQIKYIFITPFMKSGIVWKKENQGLLFLLKNSERFKSIYNKNGVEIWEFS